MSNTRGQEEPHLLQVLARVHEVAVRERKLKRPPLSVQRLQPGVRPAYPWTQVRGGASMQASPQSLCCVSASACCQDLGDHAPEWSLREGATLLGGAG